MNDSYCEQLVARKSSAANIALRVLAIAAIPLIAFLLLPLIGTFSLLVATLYAVLAYYFIFPKFNVEYEYDLLNHDMEISVIYSKANRKKKMSLDIQDADIIAPKGSPRLNSYHPEKTYDFTSRTDDAKAFAIMLPVGGKLTCVLIEPDDAILKNMRGWMGSKMFLD